MNTKGLNVSELFCVKLKETNELNMEFFYSKEDAISFGEECAGNPHDGEIVCTRIPVKDGHPSGLEEIIATWE